MLRLHLEISPSISDIILYCHFVRQRIPHTAGARKTAHGEKHNAEQTHYPRRVENNLKNIDLTVPRMFLSSSSIGLFCSGKSSLAFDTIYAEGQRRYVESLSSYARQFLGQMDKPDVDSIEGLSPAISIDQKTTSKKPALDRRQHGRSGDLRLSAPSGRASVCPLPEVRWRNPPADHRPDHRPNRCRRGPAQILAPVVRARKGEYAPRFLRTPAGAASVRVRVDGSLDDLSEDISAREK